MQRKNRLFIWNKGRNMYLTAVFSLLRTKDTFSESWLIENRALIC